MTRRNKNTPKWSLAAGAPSGQALVSPATGPTLVKNINEQVAIFSDGSLRFNLQKFGTPADQYDADIAWIERSLGWIRLHFAQMGKGGRLHSEVVVKYSPEAFFGHFWGNSREFHATLKARGPVPRLPADPERDKLTPEAMHADKQHVLTANFDILAHSGNEASMDFFHLPPAAVGAWSRNRDPANLRVAPMLRVLLSTGELARLLDHSEPIAAELEQFVAPLLAERVPAP